MSDNSGVAQRPETVQWSGEQVVLCQDETLGLRAVIAVDSTVLGSGLGGVRYKRYATDADGVREAERLAATMTLKNAVAGLPYGGAKSVILAGGGEEHADRGAVMRRFGAFVARLAGTYLPGVDMGTTMDDLHRMAEGGAEIISSDENPSPATAQGVHHAIRAAVSHRYRGDGLAGHSVLVQGVGQVGAALGRLLVADGARVLVCDAATDRAAAVAAEIGAEVVDPTDAIGTPCDVFAPCSVARVVDADSWSALRCDIVAGAANDTLADGGYAERLADRGILYVPDFVANAGGVLQMHAVRTGTESEGLPDALAAIEKRVLGLLAEADDDGITPLDAATRTARRLLSAA